MDTNTKKLKIACYSGSLSMSVVSNLSPLLFLTFRDLYGISYSLLGLLILINYISQLTIDLCFSFFSHKINIPLIVKITPIISIIGLLIYALWPIIFNSNVYIGLVIGTIIFSSASGFNEVLISPIIEALPSENKEVGLVYSCIIIDEKVYHYKDVYHGDRKQIRKSCIIDARNRILQNL